MRKLIVFIMLLTALCFAAGPLLAGDKAILDITRPAPAAEADLKEGEFDGEGYIDRITDKEVVIDDAYYRLSSGVVFKLMGGSSSSSANFPVGTRVWFMLYTDNTIKSVWKEGG